MAHVVLVQHQARSDEPYEVYEVGDAGEVVATLGTYADLDVALEEGKAFASSANVRFVDEATSPPVADEVDPPTSRFDEDTAVEAYETTETTEDVK